MFYVTSATMSGPPELIGLAPYNSMQATAKSLRGPWTKRPGFVPLEVRVGTFPEMMAYPGHIVKDNGEYLMFFGAPAVSAWRRPKISMPSGRSLPGRSLARAITISKTPRSTLSPPTRRGSCLLITSTDPVATRTPPMFSGQKIFAHGMAENGRLSLMARTAAGAPRRLAWRRCSKSETAWPWSMIRPVATASAT